ncbi:MAG TPA: hypothetical protein VKR31_03530 [Rhizomicrobium sp.]|nr:hypothetical protein [Rhizomicrobium sp.]
MNTPAQNVVGLFAGIWPRVAVLSNSPSLLVIALIVNLAAVIPTAFRMHKENLACDTGVAACTDSAATHASPTR